jgi:hypothetical protein
LCYKQLHNLHAMSWHTAVTPAIADAMGLCILMAASTLECSTSTYQEGLGCDVDTIADHLEHFHTKAAQGTDVSGTLAIRASHCSGGLAAHCGCWGWRWRGVGLDDDWRAGLGGHRAGTWHNQDWWHHRTRLGWCRGRQGQWARAHHPNKLQLLEPADL